MKGHAAHNEAACDLLHKSADFPDWVVTTAFYASMHGIYERLFPLKTGGTTYASFDTYFGQRYSRGPSRGRYTKHEATVDLVRQHLPHVASHYRLLKDSCFNARYRNYKVKPQDAAIARQQLQQIKSGLAKKVK